MLAGCRATALLAVLKKILLVCASTAHNRQQSTSYSNASSAAGDVSPLVNAKMLKKLQALRLEPKWLRSINIYDCHDPSA